MKGLFIIDVLERINGGAERQAYYLATGLRDYGIEMEILVLQGKCKDKGVFDGHNIPVFQEDIRRAYGREGRLAAERWMKRAAGYDFVLTCHFGSDLWFSFIKRALLKKAGRAPKWASLKRDAGFWMRPQHLLAYRLYIHPYVDMCISVSQEVDKRLCAGMPKDKTVVIYNGVDLKRFEAAPYVLPNPGEKLVAVYVANLSPVKGHRTVLKALHTMEKRDSMKVRFIGEDKGIGSELKRLAQKWGITGSVEFVGPSKDVAGEIALAHFCINASRSEGMSNAVLEYMAVGRPVVASDIPSNREVLGDDGIYFGVGDYKGLGRLFDGIARHPSGIAGKANSLRQRVEGAFSIDGMIKRYCEVITGMVER